MSVRQGFYIVMGDGDELKIVEDPLGMPGAKRYRTEKHALEVLHEGAADSATGRTERDFGPGEVIS